MKRAWIATLLALFLLLGRGANAFSTWETRYEYSVELESGLTLSEYHLYDGSDDSRQTVYLLNVDPRENPRLFAALALPGGYVRGLSSTSECAKAMTRAGYNVLAGVNADFFDTVSGGSLGFSMQDGRWLSTSEYDGWCFALTRTGKAIIAQPKARVSASAYRDGQPLFTDVKVDIVNACRGDVRASESKPTTAYEARKNNDLVLYTSDYSASTHTAENGVEVTITTDQSLFTNEKVVGRVERVSTDGNSRLTPGTMVLSATGAMKNTLAKIKSNDTIEILLTANEAWADVWVCAGGGREDFGPLLIQNAEPCKINTRVYDYQYFYNRHSRTAVGVRADGSWFFVCVDGYKTGESDGVTIRELMRLMLEFGAETALNLDGGPSSTMVRKTPTGFAYVNQFHSFGYEREDGNSLMIILR